MQTDAQMRKHARKMQKTLRKNVPLRVRKPIASYMMSELLEARLDRATRHQFEALLPLASEGDADLANLFLDFVNAVSALQRALVDDVSPPEREAFKEIIAKNPRYRETFGAAFDPERP